MPCLRQGFAAQHMKEEGMEEEQGPSPPGENVWAPPPGDTGHVPPAPGGNLPPQRPGPGRALLVAAGIVAVAVAAVLVGRATAGSNSVPASSVPGVTSTPAPGPCLDDQQARGVWSDVTKRLDALVLHPDLARVATVAQGTAAQEISDYVQHTLLDHHFTEREHERLDDLSVVQPGCGGQPLSVRVTETLVQDDYLAPDGHVDHRDAGVGQSHQLLETYMHTASGWKVIDIASLDATPSPSGNIV
jgi:hypothetical protein